MIVKIIPNKKKTSRDHTKNITMMAQRNKIIAITFTIFFLQVVYDKKHQQPIRAGQYIEY